MMINKESLLKKYENKQTSKNNDYLDKADKIVDELTVYIEKYDTELYDNVMQNMLDNLTEQSFDKILTAINYKTIFDDSEKRDMVSDIYSTVCKTKKISIKQLKCFATYLKLVKVKNNYTKQF